MPSLKNYAKVQWNANDIKVLREDLTVKQAEEFLERHEKQLQEVMINRGWDALEVLLAEDQQLPVIEPDSQLLRELGK